MTRFDRRSTIAAIVLEHSECAQVFRDHRIDFCCRGGRSLEEACAEKGLDVDAMLCKLAVAIAGRAPSMTPGPDALPTAELIGYIVDRHHAYITKALPFVEALATKVAHVHGARDPKLIDLRDAVSDLAASLAPHVREEEVVLFPALRAKAPDASIVATELESMDREHRRVAEMLASVRALADDFKAPDWACTSYRTLLSELAVLEMDTLRHVHVETHVLMPRFAMTRQRSSRPAASG